ncbi:MAG: PDZ domain-containing protein [bacterium]
MWPLLAFPQTATVVYDGFTGLHNVGIHNDTAVITTLIPESPADRAGLQIRDQVIAINDSLVSGVGMNVRGIKQLLHDRSGKIIELKIKRKGEDELLAFPFLGIHTYTRLLHTTICTSRILQGSGISKISCLIRWSDFSRTR